ELPIYQVCGQIGNSAVQSDLLPSNAAGLVGIEVVSRSGVVSQSAATEQLIETREPAQAGTVVQVHEFRVHRAADRRLPAKGKAAVIATPDAHAPCWQHAEGQGAVIHFDQVDALAQAAMERALADGPVSGRRQTEALSVETD